MSRAQQRRKKEAIQARQAARAASGEAPPWAPAFYKTMLADRPKPEEVPARYWLTHEVPKPVRLMTIAVIDSVVEHPGGPPAFPPSNLWHAMSDDMSGIYEARDEHDGNLYRLFCVLDRAAIDNGISQPLVTLIGGGIKPDHTEMDPAIYAVMRERRDLYTASSPRQIFLPPGIV